jgi:hypothetical protein
VRVGAMRCHSQGLTHQAEARTCRSRRSRRSSRAATSGSASSPNRARKRCRSSRPLR